MLLFGGEAYEFGEPSGRLFTFDLTSDVLQDSAIGPFGLNGSSPSVDPNKPLPGDLVASYLEKDGNLRQPCRVAANELLYQDDLQFRRVR